MPWKAAQHRPLCQSITVTKPSTLQRRTRALRVLALRELVERHDRILHPVVLHLQAGKRLRGDTQDDT
jgi:hypothetical protein